MTTNDLTTALKKAAISVLILTVLVATKLSFRNEVSHGGELRGTYKVSRRLQDPPDNPFIFENAATAGNNPVPIGTEEIGGSINLGGMDLFRLPGQLPIIFPGQPVPPANQVVPPFQRSGSSDGFGAFGKVFLKEGPSGINPFPDGSEASAGKNPVPLGSEEIGGNINLGGMDLFRLPGQLPAIFPGQPVPPVKQEVPPFVSGGSDGGSFAAFGKMFLEEGPSGGN